MWDVRRSIRLDRLPEDRVVAFFRYRDAEDGKRAWWLVAEPAAADLCFSDPGFAIDLDIDAEARAMAEVWVGKTDLGAAMRSKRIRIRGPEHLVRSLPEWLGLSTFAYPDPAAELAERLGLAAQHSLNSLEETSEGHAPTLGGDGVEKDQALWGFWRSAPSWWRWGWQPHTRQSSATAAWN